MMKIALVHELLTMRGGAERLLKVVSEMFPETPIYTLLYDEEKLGAWFPKERVRTSSLQKYARVLGFNHHLYLPFFPKATEAWDFSEFDLVISFSSAFAHGIKVGGKTRHMCYVHSPARYLWDQTFDVLDRVCFVGARHALPLRRLQRRYLEHLFHQLRIWDCEAADHPHTLLASSKAVQRRIELYWRRKSEVLYPPVDDDWFRERTPVAMEHPDYYLIVSTLVPYKRIELAIAACNRLQKHLKIVGEGPHRQALEKISGPTIEFYGFRQNDELLDLYANAKATLFPGEEDFGLVPLESMACGTPVIAYRGGGALETVIDGQTGEFFSCHAEPVEARTNSLQQAMQIFEQKSYSKEACRKQAEKFSRERFEKGLHEEVEKCF